MSESTWWNGYEGRAATQCTVDERPTHSTLLDRWGRALPYEKPPVGFDLTPTRSIKEG
jgi:hypothetical protein